MCARGRGVLPPQSYALLHVVIDLVHILLFESEFELYLNMCLLQTLTTARCWRWRHIPTTSCPLPLPLHLNLNLNERRR